MDGKRILDICKKCGARCCKTGSADLTKKEVDRIRGSMPDLKFVKLRNNHYWIETGNDGICKCLKKDNSCKIYNLRPNFCRCWPVFLKLKKNREEYWLANCALAKELGKKDIEKMKLICEKMPRDLFRNYWGSANLSKKAENELKKELENFKGKTI